MPSSTASQTLSRIKPGLLRPAEAAAWLGLSVATLETWRSRGIGPPFVRNGKGRVLGYRIEDLERWLTKNLVRPAHNDRVRKLHVSK